jgi:hypothetical protein
VKQLLLCLTAASGDLPQAGMWFIALIVVTLWIHRKKLRHILTGIARNAVLHGLEEKEEVQLLT